MKTVIISTLALIFLFSCSSPDKTTETLTIITGEVSGFSEVSEHNMLSLIFADPVSGRQEISTTLDSLGRFRIESHYEITSVHGQSAEISKYPVLYLLDGGAHL